MLPHPHFDAQPSTALKSGQDELKLTNAPLRDSSASSSANSLRQEALGAPPPSNSDKKSEEPKLNQTGEERKAEETKLFTDRYHQYNFELDPMTKDHGPYQTLEEMNKAGRLPRLLTERQILAESERIADRDFKILGRNYYLPSDHVTRWTKSEIEKGVQDAVSKPTGIDISSWNYDKDHPVIDFKQVKAAGYQFVFIEATRGNDFINEYFDASRTGARDAGLATGYYHFFKPNEPVADQVNDFVKTVGKAEPNSLRLFIDAEIDTKNPSSWEPYSVQQRVQMIDEFCQGVKKALGVTPQLMVYASPSFVDEKLGDSPQLAKYGLFLANYNVPEPDVPGPWSKYDYWQYTSKGHVPGIKGDVCKPDGYGCVDLDLFNGTGAQMIGQDALEVKT